MAILSLKAFQRNPKGRAVEDGGEPQRSRGMTPETLHRLRRLLEPDEQAVPQTPSMPAAPIADEKPPPLSASVVHESIPTADESSVLLPVASDEASVVTDLEPSEATGPEPLAPPVCADTDAIATAAYSPMSGQEDAEETAAAARLTAERDLARVEEESRARLDHMDHALAAAVEMAQNEATLRQAAETRLDRLAEAGARHLAEQELARGRDESETRLNRIEQELAAALERSHSEAARLLLAEIEFDRFKEESSRRLAEMNERVEAMVEQSRAATAKQSRKQAQTARPATPEPKAVPSRSVKANRKATAVVKAKSAVTKRSSTRPKAAAPPTGGRRPRKRAVGGGSRVEVVRPASD